MKSQLRVAIVGSRRRASLHDRKIVFDLIERLIKSNSHRDLVLVSGACRLGADNFAAEASKIYGVPIKEFPVPSGDYKGKWQFAQAAFARNKLVAEDATVGYALVAEDRKGGTEDTVKHFLNLKKNIYLVDGTGRTYLSSMEEQNVSDATKDPDKT